VIATTLPPYPREALMHPTGLLEVRWRDETMGRRGEGGVRRVTGKTGEESERIMGVRSSGAVKTVGAGWWVLSQYLCHPLCRSLCRPLYSLLATHVSGKALKA